MIEVHYGGDPNNAANSPMAASANDTTGPWLPPIEDFYPAGAVPAEDSDDLSVPDRERTSRRWIDGHSDSLYRFRVGAAAPQGAGNSFQSGSRPTSAGPSEGTPSVTNNPSRAGSAGTGVPAVLSVESAATGAATGGSTNSAALAASTVQIGSAGGLVFNITYDSSVANAPAGFSGAISYVAQLYASNFSNPITINLDVGWGEIAGQAMGAGALGESETYLNSYSYSQVRSGLVSRATSTDQKTAVGTLPASAPTGSTSYSIATAEAKALGLIGASSDLDGYVGFGSSYSYTFDPNDQAVSGKYDFIGVAAHEISEVMGRDSYLGEGLGYTALDLFRYSSPGTRQLTVGRTAYFSIDGGATNLDNFNTVSGGDAGDWASTAGNDAFNAYSNSGVANTVSATDLRVINVLGYQLAGSSSSSPSPTPTSGPPPSSTPIPSPPPTSPPPSRPQFAAATLDTMQPGDFANRGANDTIWFGSDGSIRIYEITNGQVTAAPLVSQVGSDWGFAAVGHFFGAGAASDYMLRRSDGTLELYQVQNDQVVGASRFAVVGSDWSVAAAADFYQTGNDSLLLRRSDGTLELYNVQGGQMAGASQLGVVGSDWEFAGTGNFYNNGTLDFLAEQRGTGALELWQVRNGQIVGAAQIGIVGGDEHVVGVADFNNDGVSDILMQSDGGTFRIYEFQNGQVAGAPVVAQIGTNWQPAGVGNFSGNGMDFLMRSGQAVELYHVQNYQVTGASTLATVGDNLQIAGAFFNHLV